MTRSRRSFLAIALCALFSTAASARTDSTAPANGPQVFCKSGGKQTSCNGISVGRPKIFDNRSLTLQIEALQDALKKHQVSNPTIDLKSVMSALANTQGLTQSELSTVLSVLGNPTQSTSLTTDTKTGNVDSNGNPLPNTTDTQNAKNVSSVTPTAPAFDSFASLPTGFNPAFGPSATDLLNDQVNLNYQIINLQMILERALSDRLYLPDDRSQCDDQKNCTRLQSVLGFNVTIDPPRVANDAVAVVEVTLMRTKESKSTDTNESGDNDLSLVAMMPQEKTYNSAALSSSSHAYNGAAVVNAFQVSGGYRKRNQTFYVYRDTDTLAYERMTKGGELVFGWMFRPVLGRRSVSPGLRQLFAVVSLPKVDCDQQDVAGKNKGECGVTLEPNVRTYWKKFDRSTQTSFESHDANLARKFWYDLSATLSKPQIFKKDSYLNTADYAELNVRSSSFYEDSLRPVVQDVSWHPTGEKTVLVSITGRNFFTNTQVKLGDTTYSEDNKNLVLKSDQSFDLITTFDQLTTGPASILGRYGLSVPIVLSSPPNVSGTIQGGIRIGDPKIGPSIDGYRTLQISLNKRAVQTDIYRTALSKIDELQRQLDEKKADYQRKGVVLDSKQNELDSKKKELETLKSSNKPAAAQLNKVQGEITKLTEEERAAEQGKKDAESALGKAQNDLSDVQNSFYKNYGLERDELPSLIYGIPAGRSVQRAPDSKLASNQYLQSPIISVNGTALRMPYDIRDVSEDRNDSVLAHLEIRTTFPDGLITNGSALIQVSWPFYDSNRWTSTLRFTNPDDQFKVDRVSAKTIFVRRETGAGFEPINRNPCWFLVVGDTPVQLNTANCPKSAPSSPGPVKGSPMPKPYAGPTIPKSNYIALVTVGDKEVLPTHAVLLAPDGTVYPLTIPDFPDKKADSDAAAKPIAMKQNDAAWIKVTLPAGKSAKTVEANGATLKWNALKADSKNSSSPAKGAPETIEVEVTRALTAKTGSVDVSVFDASGTRITRQTIAIACNQCADKKGD